VKSKPYKVSGKLFRYDFDSSTVEYIAKAGTEEIEADREWKETHGRSLYGIGDDGYMVLDTIGLNRKNWENRAARDEYLSGWAVDLDAEAEALVADFLRWEM
jgi:hypothetical protein